MTIARHWIPRFAGTFVILAILTAIFTACAPPAGEPAPQPSDTETPTAAPTSPVQPLPPSSDPTTTDTPEPTPTKVAFPVLGAASATAYPSVAALAGCHVTQLPEVGQDATLSLAPSEGLPETTARGEALVIVGRVYAEDCTPLPGANLQVWQTDAAGEYGPDHDTQEMECCYLQGAVRTDENGYYKLLTQIPGHYKGQNQPPPAHIHVEVSHPDAIGEMLEIVFAGDPYLRSPALDGYVVSTLEHFAPPGERGEPYLFGVADILLPRNLPSQELSPEASGTTALRTFEILPESSEAAYQIREEFAGLPLPTTARAITRLLEGSIHLDLSSPQPLQSLEVTVDLRGLDSGEINRDEKLVDRWLVTQEFPYAYFIGKSIEDGPVTISEGIPVSFTLIGELTIRDVTRPVEMQTTARLDGDRITGSATTAIKMTEFGIDPPNLLGMVTVEDEVLLTINLTAQETQPESGG